MGASLAADCNKAKSKLEVSLHAAGIKLKSGLEDLRSIDKSCPGQIIIAFDVECLPKQHRAGSARELTWGSESLRRLRFS